LCFADLGVAKRGGSARPKKLSRPGGGADTQGKGHGHAFLNFA
jgi:hypothetical protein